MLTRRHFIQTAGTALGLAPLAAQAHVGPPHTTPESFDPVVKRIRDDIEVGSLHVFPKYFVLYHVTAPGVATEYHVAVGDAGRNFIGTARVGRKAEWPSWTPTQNMIRREPHVYGKFAGGVPGGPDNPLGARALYLYRGNRDTMYRIHGTSQPWTIGTAVSSGCIRLKNEHVIGLYDQVKVGAQVKVWPS
ncbi:L,D-transpeptidase [Oceaniglobus ichthyenteri]|uniref:L,D-transpeptidase n=1 Tax=Oceaniglobus ichthyenteri TaxID=2136177 RepID=UPI000D3DBF49|nr:L,D-transpeptidase [Oceaniglobus ichthyenteri]